MRNHLMDARCNGGQQFAYIQIGEEGVAQLQHYRFFSALAVGKVASDFRVAGDFTGVVADGGEDRIGPEARAVFADAPALFFNPAALSGEAHQVAWAPAVNILLDKETGEVLPHN